MATVNTSTIINAVPDPEFVTKSVRFILDRGIMGLGSGILKSVDGNQVAVVLPELHDDDNTIKFIERADNLLYKAKKLGRNNVITEQQIN